MVNKTIFKALTVLNLFTAEEPILSLSEVVRLTKIPKPTALRILNTLEQVDFITKMPDGKYKLGLALLHLGNLVSAKLDLRKVAMPHMESLCKEIGITVRLLVRNNNKAIFVDKCMPRTKIGIYNMEGLRMKLYIGSAARALIAFLPVSEIDELITTFQQEDKLTESQVNGLRDTIEKERELGYSISFQEYVEGTAGIAAPVLDNTGKVVASISLAGLIGQFSEENLPLVAAKLKKTVNAISIELGYTGPEIK